MKHEHLCHIPGRSGIFKLIYKKGMIKELKPIKIDNSINNNIDWLTAGLFDIQITGMLGHYLSGSDLTIKKVLEIDKELESRGILFWCPTICSQKPEIIIKNLEIIKKIINQKLTPGIFGIHMEGHYISSEDNCRGVHSKEFIKDPIPQEFDCWQKVAGGHIKLFSLSPERNGAIDFINKLRNEGVKVGLAHHNAAHELILEAVAAGADLATHLVNGCPSLMHRHYNVIWSQLSIDEMWASFIADGFHIPHFTLKAVIKSKGINKSILTSDLFYLSGLPEGEYLSKTDKRKVILKDEGLWVKGEDMLSGAAKTLNQNVEYIVRYCGFSIEEALIMASINPAKYFGIEDKIMIYPGRKGPLAIFSWKNDRIETIKILQ